MRRTALIAAALSACLAAPVAAQSQDSPKEVTVDLKRLTADGTGETLGSVVIRNAEGGVQFVVNASPFEPGAHGFHVHQNASCDPQDGTPGGAAGGHWDPQDTGTHQGPEGDGHLGDLPKLEANAEGVVDQVVQAPRIDDMQRLRGHALIVHQGGDTYSDDPKLGGGGARVACAIIPES